MALVAGRTGGSAMTETLEIVPTERLDFLELDDESAEVLPSRETMCCWHYCAPVYCCYPVYIPKWCCG
jgi:hypothetical protein